MIKYLTIGYHLKSRTFKYDEGQVLVIEGGPIDSPNSQKNAKYINGGKKCLDST